MTYTAKPKTDQFGRSHSSVSMFLNAGSLGSVSEVSKIKQKACMVEDFRKVKLGDIYAKEWRLASRMLNMGFNLRSDIKYGTSKSISVIEEVTDAKYKRVFYSSNYHIYIDTVPNRKENDE